MATRPRFPSAHAAWLVLAWLVFMSVLLAFAGGYIVDDAFVVFRVAVRVAAGAPWALQGSSPADGVTAPLWGALLALCAPFWPPPLAARWLGSLGVLTGVACTLLAHAPDRQSRSPRVKPAPPHPRGDATKYAVLFLAVQLPLVVWAGAGLETGLTTLAIAVAGRGLVQADSVPPQGRFGRWLSDVARYLALASVPWLRPELVPVALVAAWYPPSGVTLTRRRVAGVLTVVSATAAVVILRVVLFGHPLPLAALAKPSDPVQGARYVALALLASGALSAVVATLAIHVRSTPLGAKSALAAFGSRRVRVALGVGLLSVVLAGGDWMPAGRLLVPLLPLLAVSVADALACLPRQRGLVTALTLALPIALMAAAIPELRAQPGARERGFVALQAALEGATCVALVDIGYLAYVGGYRVVDLGGITDLEIARLPGGHLAKRIPETLLLSRGVDAIVLHSTTPARVGTDSRINTGQLLSFRGYPVELQVARMPFVREQFRVSAEIAYAPGYHYVVLRRGP